MAFDISGQVDAIRVKAIAMATREVTGRAQQSERDTRMADQGLAAPLSLIDQQAITDVEYLFADYAEHLIAYSGLPDPAAFRAAAGAYSKAHQRIAVDVRPAGGDHPSQLVAPVVTNGTFDQIELVQNYLSVWTGDAAKNFNENYLARLETVLAHHQAAVWAMKVVHDQAALVWEDARSGVVKVLAEGLAALDAMTVPAVTWSSFFHASAEVAGLMAMVPGMAPGVQTAADTLGTFTPLVPEPEKAEAPAGYGDMDSKVASRSNPGGAGTKAEAIVLTILGLLQAGIRHSLEEEGKLADFANALEATLAKSPDYEIPAPDMSGRGSSLTSDGFMGKPNYA